MLVMLALGFFTSARIYSEMGADHRLFNTLSRWSRRWRTPARALVAQGLICLGYIFGVWIAEGDREYFEAALTLTAAVFWTFFFLTGVALIRLRFIDPHTPRPFRVPGYPLLPLLFCLSCGYMIVGSILYDPLKSLIGLCVLMAGLPFYFIPQKLKQRRAKPDLQPVGERPA